MCVLRQQPGTHTLLRLLPYLATQYQCPVPSHPAARAAPSPSLILPPGSLSERTAAPRDPPHPDPPHPPPSPLCPSPGTHLEDILRGHGGGIRLAHDALVGAGGGRLLPGAAEPQQRALHAARPPGPLRRPARRHGE